MTSAREQSVRPRHQSPAYGRLWREWCFLRVAVRHFRANFVILVGLLVGGGLLFQQLEPEKHHSFSKAMYFTWSLVFGGSPEEFPRHPVLQMLFFLVPLVGLLVILEGLVDFALILRDRQRNERSWCKVMAAELSDHVILVGLGKLGFRTFRLLRQLGRAVVVIERSADNQFLEEVRRDGAPLFIGDARREAFLTDANTAKAQSIILAADDDLANLEIALDARRLNPNIRVVLRMFDQNMADKIRQGFDLQTAMSQSALSAPAFVMAALAGDIVGSLAIDDDEYLVFERWKVQPGDAFCDRAIADVTTAHRVQVIRRRPRGAKPQLMPPPETRLTAGDELLVQGTMDTLNTLRAGV